MKKLKKCFMSVTLIFGTLVASPVSADCFPVFVSTNSDKLIGEIVTVSLLDHNSKNLAQSWQLQITGKEPKTYTVCIKKAGEYIVRYSGMGMAWQEYHNLFINRNTKLRIHMKTGNDGRVLLVSEPYELPGN